MPGMFESYDGHDTPRICGRIETPADVLAFFGGRTSQQIFDILGDSDEDEAQQQAAQNEEAS